MEILSTVSQDRILYGFLESVVWLLTTRSSLVLMHTSKVTDECDSAVIGTHSFSFKPLRKSSNVLALNRGAASGRTPICHPSVWTTPQKNKVHPPLEKIGLFRSQCFSLVTHEFVKPVWSAVFFLGGKFSYLAAFYINLLPVFFFFFFSFQTKVFFCDVENQQIKLKLNTIIHSFFSEGFWNILLAIHKSLPTFSRFTS